MLDIAETTNDMYHNAEYTYPVIPAKRVAHGPTYQSGTMSQDIARWNSFAEYNPNEAGIPVRLDSYDGEAMVSSQAGFHAPNAAAYRFAQRVHDSIWSDNFDWETEDAFEVARFEAQFGMHYDAGVLSLPSYDESRLIYGR